MISKNYYNVGLVLVEKSTTNKKTQTNTVKFELFVN